MGIGVSVVLLAVGAVLAFAIDVESSRGVNLNTIGVILMVAGAIAASSCPSALRMSDDCGCGGSSGSSTVNHSQLNTRNTTATAPAAEAVTHRSHRWRCHGPSTRASHGARPSTAATAREYGPPTLDPLR